jgi:tetratricopeptide (TPR) repeat protein
MRTPTLAPLVLAALLLASGIADAAHAPKTLAPRGKSGAAHGPASRATPAIPPPAPTSLVGAGQPTIASASPPRSGGSPSTQAASPLTATGLARPGPGASLATTTIPANAAQAWRWALPLAGLLGIGVVVATARGLRPAPTRRRAALPRLRFAVADLRSMLEAGRDALASERIEEALAWFTQATTLDRRAHLAHYCRGVCLGTLGRHHEAYAAIVRAVDLHPAEGAYLYELARAASRTGRAAEAMDALGPLLRALPDLAAVAEEDEAFAPLADHPRFLAMTGRL